MPRPVHFEFPTDDPDKAVKFYGDVFGWQFQKWDGPMEYWMVKTGDGPGIDGGMMRRMPGAATCNTIDVPDLDASVKKIEESGGKIALPKMPIPGIGWLAYAVDLDGNTFGIMQTDPSAA